MPTPAITSETRSIRRRPADARRVGVSTCKRLRIRIPHSAIDRGIPMMKTLSALTERLIPMKG